jgi:uncharacterized cofD-like protein
MADDGGSSGRLRDEYGILPPGDIRQCMIALAKEENIDLRRLFNYRLKDGHSLGNFMITALMEDHGVAPGIKKACKLLGINENILPVSLDNVTLIGETQEGEVLEGQTRISYPGKDITLKKLFFRPEAFVYKESAEEIRAADKIVICPGDLYGSILPSFAVEGIVEAIRESNAKIVYVCNLVTKSGYSSFKASDFVRMLEMALGRKLDKILLNTKMPSEEVREKYISENSRIVGDDLGEDNRVVRGEFLSEYPSEPKTILRHVPEKVSRAIMEI